MNDRTQFRRLAGRSALLAGLLAATSMELGIAAVRADLRVLAAPERILDIGAAGAALLRWAMLCDVFGYYLLLAPAGLYLHAWLKDRRPNRVAMTEAGKTIPACRPDCIPKSAGLLFRPAASDRE